MYRTVLFVVIAALSLSTPAGAAVVLVQDLGVVTTTSGTSLVLTVPAGGVAAGDLLHVDAAIAGAVFPAVTDSRGNTYTVAPSVASGGFSLSGFWCHVTTALVSGDTVTLSWTGSFAAVAGAAEYSGLTATPLDQWTAATGSSTSPAATVIIPTTQANELLTGAFATFGTNTAASTGAGFAQLTSVNFVVGPSFMSLTREYRVVSATGLYTADGTLAPAAPWKAQIVTYKDTVAPVELLRVDVR